MAGRSGAEALREARGKAAKKRRGWRLGGAERAVETFKEPGASPTVKHFMSFFESVRSRKATVEDIWAGHRAAACAHLVNHSAETGRVVEWDFKADRQKA